MDTAVQGCGDREREREHGSAAVGADDLASPASYRSGGGDDIRRHVDNLAAALPTLPRELERTGRVLGLELDAQGLVRVLLLALVFVALGFGTDRPLPRSAAGEAVWITAFPLATGVARRRALATRVPFAVGHIAALS